MRDLADASRMTCKSTGVGSATDDASLSDATCFYESMPSSFSWKRCSSSTRRSCCTRAVVSTSTPSLAPPHARLFARRHRRRRLASTPRPPLPPPPWLTRAESVVHGPLRTVDNVQQLIPLCEPLSLVDNSHAGVSLPARGKRDGQESAGQESAAARIACRPLGFVGGVAPPPRTLFGEASGTIDGVACSGTEAAMSCTFVPPSQMPLMWFRLHHAVIDTCMRSGSNVSLSLRVASAAWASLSPITSQHRPPNYVGRKATAGGAPPAGCSFDLAANAFLRLSSRREAPKADLLRFSDHISPLFLLQDQKMCGDVLLAFHFLTTPELSGHRIESSPEFATSRDEDISENHGDVIELSFSLFESIDKYVKYFVLSLEDLREGVYIQQTRAGVLLDEDGKQPICEELYLSCGVMPLRTDCQIEGAVRERMLIAYHQHNGASSIDSIVDFFFLVCTFAGLWPAELGTCTDCAPMDHRCCSDALAGEGSRSTANADGRLRMTSPDESSHNGAYRVKTSGWADLQPRRGVLALLSMLPISSSGGSGRALLTVLLLALVDGAEASSAAPSPVPMTGASATQSSTSSGGDAGRAIDGDSDVNWTSDSCTHTTSENAPWWEVTVPIAQPLQITSVKVTNRGDCCEERLNGFDLAINGVTCASNNQVGQGVTAEVTCAASLPAGDLTVRATPVHSAKPFPHLHLSTLPRRASYASNVSRAGQNLAVDRHGADDLRGGDLGRDDHCGDGTSRSTSRRSTSRLRGQRCWAVGYREFAVGEKRGPRSDSRDRIRR